MYIEKMSAEDRAAADERKVAWERLQREFVYQSEKISGRGYEDGGEDAFWKTEGVKTHLELAMILNRRNGNYVGLWLINATLTRRPNRCTRTGIPGMSKGLVPDGNDVERILNELDAKIRNDFELFKTASPEEKNMLAWHAHDEVLCSDFFKSGNGRTGRLLYNHVRTIFGLDTQVIYYEESAGYFAKLQLYKHNTYLPRLRAQMECAA